MNTSFPGVCHDVTRNAQRLPPAAGRWSGSIPEAGPRGPWPSPRPGTAPLSRPGFRPQPRRRPPRRPQPDAWRSRPGPGPYDGRGHDVRPALLITRDELLLDDLLRLAAAAGVSLDVAHDTTSGAARLVGGRRRAGRRRPGRPGGRAAAAPARRRCTSSATARSRDAVFRDALAGGAADVVELPAAEALAGRAAHRRGRRAGGAPGGWHARAWSAGPAARAPRPSPARSALTAARGRPAVLVDLDPLGPGRRPGGRARRRRRPASAGTRWSAPAAGSGPARCAPRCRSRTGWPCSPGRRDRRSPWTPASVREVLSAARRGHDVVVVDLPADRRRRERRGGSRCDQVLVVAGPRSPGSPLPARSPPCCARSTGRLGLVVRGPAAAVPAEQVARRPRAAAGRRGADPAPAGRARRPGPRAGARPALAAGPGRPGRARRPAAPAGGSREAAPSRGVPAEVLDEVREQLARSGAALTPEVVARALRDQGRPGRGRHRAGGPRPAPPGRPRRRPARAAAPAAGGHRRAGQRRRRGLRRPGRGARADLDAVRRRRRRTPARAAAGRLGRSPAGRRHAVRRPAAARRHPVPRRARAAGAARHGDLAAGAAGPGVHARGARWSAAPSTPTRAVAAAADRRRPAGVPGQRRHRHRARPPCCPRCSRWSTRGTGWWSSRTPASCAPTTRTSSASSPGRPTSRARARCRCGCWSARRCGCGPTGWSSARSGAPRSPTCSPR